MSRANGMTGAEIIEVAHSQAEEKASAELVSAEPGILHYEASPNVKAHPFSNH